MIKVLLLFGGESFEHEISIKSAKNLYNNIDKKEFDITNVYISKDNNWYESNLNFDDINIHKLKKINNIICYIKEFDIVINIIHGNGGEDGKLQSLFELFNIKYIGSNSLSSFLCMNKDLTKLVLENNNINQTKYHIYKNIKDTTSKLDYPVIVKPNNGGSSIGIMVARNDRELKKAVKLAGMYSNKIIIEEFLENCSELECSVIENNKLYVSTIGQIIHTNEFYDYEDKYIKNESKVVIPAKIGESLSKRIKNLARKAFNLLECRDFARIDFLVDSDYNIYLNEINTIPGFTDISMFSKLLEFDNINIRKFITKLIKKTTKL